MPLAAPITGNAGASPGGMPRAQTKLSSGAPGYNVSSRELTQQVLAVGGYASYNN
jgi:hypothetical protein